MKRHDDAPTGPPPEGPLTALARLLLNAVERDEAEERRAAAPTPPPDPAPAPAARPGRPRPKPRRPRA
jgi:hypothetical protein